MKTKQKVREVFEQLASKTSDGCVTPEMMVKASKSANSPLHKNFEWDNTKAGHEYRVWQARQLLSTMTVDVEDGRVREFENLIVKVDDGNKRGYFHIDQILENKNLKRAVIDQVQRELKLMLDKYERYEKIYITLNKAKRNIDELSTHASA